MPKISQVDFRITPSSALTDDELRLLTHLERTAIIEPLLARVDIAILQAAPPEARFDNLPAGLDADVRYEAGILSLLHSDFVMSIDTPGARATLYRRETSGFSLYFGIRNAWLCTAAEHGIIPLHSAGLVIDGQMVLFFGPSGAGKTTLSSRSPFAVASDELNALSYSDGAWKARASGFWGRESRLERVGPISEFPLKGVVVLEKGDAFSMSRISAAETMKRILASVMLPPVPHLWQRMMNNVSALVSAVPAYRMAWSLNSDPWESLRSSLPDR